MKKYKIQVERIANKVASDLNVEVLNLQYVHSPFSPYYRVELSNDIIISVGDMNVEYGIRNENFTIDYDFEFSGLIDEDGIHNLIKEITTKVGDMT